MQFFPEAPRRAFRETPPKNVLLDTSRCDVTLAMGGKGGGGGVVSQKSSSTDDLSKCCLNPRAEKKKIKIALIEQSVNKNNNN